MSVTYQLKKIELQQGEIEVLEMTDSNGVVSNVPIDPLNSDYQKYLASLNEASTL